MSYHITIPVDFENPPAAVYDAIADLGRWPEWMENLQSVSTTTPMHAGLRFSTVTQVLGRTNRSEILVRQMVPHQLIVLQSQAGLFDFLNEYHFAELAPSRCRLTLQLNMNFSQAVFNLSRPVAEATAEAKIRGHLEKLSSQMASASG
jgi:ribosome-associated toxin RatA of RatAB toxin-antitoxin module